jgi:hypothetical protein
MGILTLYVTKWKQKENSHMFSINSFTIMEYFFPYIGKNTEQQGNTEIKYTYIQMASLLTSHNSGHFGDPHNLSHFSHSNNSGHSGHTISFRSFRPFRSSGCPGYLVIPVIWSSGHSVHPEIPANLSFRSFRSSGHSGHPVIPVTPVIWSFLSSGHLVIPVIRLFRSFWSYRSFRSFRSFQSFQSFQGIQNITLCNNVEKNILGN